jgi:endoglucanase
MIKTTTAAITLLLASCQPSCEPSPPTGVSSAVAEAPVVDPGLPTPPIAHFEAQPPPPVPVTNEHVLMPLFVGGSQWVNQANVWQTTRPADAATMRAVGQMPMGWWLLGDNNVTIENTVRSLTTKGAEQGTAPVLVLYNIPHRDCSSQWSAGGVSEMNAYQWFLDVVERGIADRHAVVIVEPDALADLDCLDAVGRSRRIEMIRIAVSMLESLPNVQLYVDIGNSGMRKDPQRMADLLYAVGADQADGFSVNVSAYYTDAEALTYARAVRAVTGMDFVIDSSRNGVGTYQDQWCNPVNRALGAKPSFATGVAGWDYRLWIKPPGQSDGECVGKPFDDGLPDPPPGVWMPEEALQLARRAGW